MSDFARQSLTCPGQDKTTILLVFEQAFRIEHVRDRREDRHQHYDPGQGFDEDAENEQEQVDREQERERRELHRHDRGREILRHAFDADHIAAIDNTTRKLMEEKTRPLSVGFWFSLGHSTIVFGMCVALALGIRSLAGQVADGNSALHAVTGDAGLRARLAAGARRRAGTLPTWRRSEEQFFEGVRDLLAWFTTR